MLGSRFFLFFYRPIDKGNKRVELRPDRRRAKSGSGIGIVPSYWFPAFHSSFFLLPAISGAVWRRVLGEWRTSRPLRILRGAWEMWKYNEVGVARRARRVDVEPCNRQKADGLWRVKGKGEEEAGS